MPYWDLQVDADNVTQSVVWDLVYGVGGDGNSSESNVVTDGPFAYTEFHVGAYSFNTVIPKAATYYLNRSISESIFQLASQSSVDECNEAEVYEDYWDCLGQAPHSAGHAGTGGVVSITFWEIEIHGFGIANLLHRCKILSYPLETPFSSCTTTTWIVSGGNGSQ